MKAAIIVFNNLNYIILLKNFLKTFLEANDFDVQKSKKVLLACEEAFLHLVKNAYDIDEEGEIRVDISLKHNLEIAFSDKGLPFNKELIKEYDPNNYDINQFDTESFGLYLINKIADELLWVNHGRNGKELKIVFYNDEKDVTETSNKDDLIPYDKNIKITNDSYDIHLIRDNEYIQVSRCVYRTYGYSYPNEDLYFPERIKRCNEEGTLVSVVATYGDGEVVGHYAIERPDLGLIAESGQAVIIPAHRGNNLLVRLREFIEEEAKKLKLHGIYSQPVTNHTRTQKVNINFNSKPFGISLGLVPKTLQFKKMQVHSFEQRVSCMYYFKSLITPEKKEYYLLPSYKELVSRILQNADFPLPNYLTSECFLKKETVVEYKFYSDWQFGVISVKEIGNDCFNIVKQAFFDLLKSNSEMIYVDLPLEEKGCDLLMMELKKIRFVFGLLKPSAFSGKDVLRMQFINCELDLSGLNVLGDCGNDILNFIINEVKSIC